MGRFRFRRESCLDDEAAGAGQPCLKAGPRPARTRLEGDGQGDPGDDADAGRKNRDGACRTNRLVRQSRPLPVDRGVALFQENYEGNHILMKVIGLTGSIGSGKSTVANIMRQMGVAILCADTAAKKVVEKGATAYKKIIKTFGQKVVNKDKSLNRTRLGEIVFSSEAKRKVLNSIVHPEVINELKKEISRMETLQRKVVVLDIPLLYE